MRLNDKVVVVTGASRGIGAAYVTAFQRAGARVVALARSFPDGPATSADPNERGRVRRWRCDVEREEDIVRTVESVLSELGRIDVLVNNAGIFTHHDALATAVDAWERMMRVNLTGHYLMIREVATHMIDRGAGAIVTMSSGAALHTERNTPGHDGLFAYAVSKAAVDRMTDFLAQELRDANIAVNALRPGPVLTPGWKNADPDAYTWAMESGVGTPCTPEALGPPMLYLAGQRADTMTGQVVAAREFGSTWGVDA